MDEIDALAVADKLLKDGVRNVRVVCQNGLKLKLRLTRSPDGTVMYLSKGKRRWGDHLQSIHPMEVYPIISHKTAEAKWISGWKKVKARLIVSGLWENIVKEIDIALAVGYNRMQQAYKDYWEIPYVDGSQDFSAFILKYPELVYINAECKQYANTSVLFVMAKPPKVKKMVIDSAKYSNEMSLRNIQEAMNKKEKCHVHGRTSYDTSFEYNPETNTACYSEEFRGCGNGHYYLALDSTHAMFYEDD